MLEKEDENNEWILNYIFLPPEIVGLQSLSEFNFDFYQNKYKPFLEEWLLAESEKAEKSRDQSVLFHDVFSAHAHSIFNGFQERVINRIAFVHHSIINSCTEEYAPLEKQVYAHNEAKKYAAKKLQSQLKKNNAAFSRKARQTN